jgi:hypothetical protein
MVFEGKARRVLMRFVPRNFGMTSSIEALPNVLPSKSKNRQSILKYFFFDLVVFSSAESYVNTSRFLGTETSGIHQGVWFKEHRKQIICDLTML